MSDRAPKFRAEPDRHRYPVTDPETAGTYVVVSARPQTEAQVQQIVASVIEDEGRVRRGRTRLILI